MQAIGAYEAKTKLPELLRRVQAGQEFEISIRGQVVARLLPAMNPAQKGQSAVANMRAFMHEQQHEGAGAGVDLRDLMEDGRA
jgi:prevent-host-death family protein